MQKKISFAVFSDPGDREPNEDSVEKAIFGDDYCFVLCDGLGGHGMGDKASQLVTAVVKSMFEQTGWRREFISESLQAGQDVLLAEQSAQHIYNKKMKTTAVELCIHGNHAYIGHVGDSRCYYFHKGKYTRRTLDHSIPQMLVAAKELEESQIRFHKERSTLLRSMGTEWNSPAYELMKPIWTRAGDSFLLCSDGFWELIDESRMCALLKEASTPGEWLGSMASVVKKNGEQKQMDNYTAIAVWIR